MTRAASGAGNGARATLHVYLPASSPRTRATRSTELAPFAPNSVRTLESTNYEDCTYMMRLTHLHL